MHCMSAAEFLAASFALWLVHAAAGQHVYMGCMILSSRHTAIVWPRTWQPCPALLQLCVLL